MEIRTCIVVVRKYLWLIALTTLLGGAIAYYVTSTMTPVYSAVATLQIDLVNDPRNQITESLVAGERLAKTYVEQIKSAALLSEVAETLGLPGGASAGRDLVLMVSVSPVRDTQLIRIIVEHPNPVLAQQLANTIAEVFIRENASHQQARYENGKSDLDKRIGELEARIRDVQTSIASLNGPDDASLPDFYRVELTRLQTELSSLNTRYTILLSSAEEFRLAAARYSDRVSVFAPADLPLVPSKPAKTRNLLLGVVVGMAVGVSIAFLREHLDDTIKSSADVTRLLGLSTLGTIVRSGRMRKPKDGLVMDLEPGSSVAEGYRTLRTNLEFCGLGGSLGSLVVTSASPGEGKSTTAANLGIVLAQAGKRVVLIDADLRRPILDRLFELNGDTGLSTLLITDGPVDPGAIRRTNVDNLRVIPSGPLPPNPAELLASARMSRLIADLTAESDLVLLDSPPALAVTDASVLASKAAGVLLVLDAGSTRREAAQWAREALEKAGARVTGVVLNKQKPGKDDGYYHHYYSQNWRKDKRKQPTHGST